ncbi:aminoglycoside phosphotransferase [Pontibacillus halophilus JSM 076056 = DSM 19796]|uniref:Aminoglycoside phosphotransferase n=1 Tax=Pontibacillus halophilus JSM 076056 = DSM 19796 TaxID=1385510 RepID=A0A0A5GGZ0_9BACI|nr:phosphotransferase family protein [Pontibacillus halophilus]KGX91294.1 aminoglycoside phosphotransferase [Pontibacillus halophilus JSM 076056 = DSM 19796]
MPYDTIPVRTGEELNEKALHDYLERHIEQANGELTVSQFGAGHSNLTYEIKMGEFVGVLRRPPLGPVAPKAHDMEREYRILQAVHPIFDKAPKPILYEEGNLLGAPFFIMERRYGVVLDTEFPTGVDASEAMAKRLSETMVDTLAELHSLEYQSSNLANIGKPEGFMERQVYGWIKRFDRALTDDVESGEGVKQWLVHHIPRDSNSALIHYDYKMNNALFDEQDYTKMVGLFDWEMTTIGDPLADLGVALSYWIEPNDSPYLRNGLGKPPITSAYDGFYTREQFMQRYAEKSGRDVTQMDFYMTFAYFKLAGIVQQIYYRYRQGQTNDKRFKGMNHFVNHLLQQARETAGL